MNCKNRLEEFLENGNFEYYLDTPVEPYVTLGIGGRVKAVVVARRLDALTRLLGFFHRHPACGPLVVLGGGSNVVFPDRDTPLVVVVNRTSGMEKLPAEGLARIESGVMNHQFLSWAADQGVGGLDFLAGVPGTVGGAAAVNAGSFGKSISMRLQKASIFDFSTGETKTVPDENFQFQYRNSRFKYGRDVILEVFLKYTGEPVEDIRRKVDEKIRYRRENHPPKGILTAGCFFKNPIIDGEKISAGRLIENAGFKGQKFQHLEISPQHANFIINSGGSSFDEIRHLEKKIVQTIKSSKGITLEREVIYISPEGEKY